MGYPAQLSKQACTPVSPREPVRPTSPIHGASDGPTANEYTAQHAAMQESLNALTALIEKLDSHIEILLSHNSANSVPTHPGCLEKHPELFVFEDEREAFSTPLNVAQESTQHPRVSKDICQQRALCREREESAKGHEAQEICSHG